MRNIKTFVANLPHHPGVYQMLDDKGRVLYVGKAKNLKKRIASYFSSRSKDLKTHTLIKQIHDIDITVTQSENEAVLLECNLIKQHQPRYNVLLRDDKSYPYILITTHHPFPKIDLYRGPKKKNGIYFGPYPSAQAVRETISLLQKLFHIRTCQDSVYEARTRPCLLYQIGRCTGPCVGLITQEAYAANVALAIKFLEGKSHEVITELQEKMETAVEALDYEQAASLRDQIARLRKIQERQYVSGVTEGDADIIGLAVKAGIVCIQLLSIRKGKVLGSRAYYPSVPVHAEQQEIMTAFLTQHYLTEPVQKENMPQEIIIGMDITEKELLENVFSEAVKHKVLILRPHRGEKKKWIDMATASARESVASHLFDKINVSERLTAFQKALNLENTPNRIECFDVSHSMGEATVASCVVFDKNGPVKSDYRRFNIEGVTPGDDIAAMRQVMQRRFKRLQKEAARLPDVVLIDGGPTQLAAGNAVMQELSINSVLLVGVSKGPLRKPGFETLHLLGQTPLHLPADSIALHLIQQIRDEAHRFAITFHRARRAKSRKQSTLELIPGIGAKRRRELLRYFGGIQGLCYASLEELVKVPGISRSLAERIFATLHDTTTV